MGILPTNRVEETLDYLLGVKRGLQGHLECSNLVKWLFKYELNLSHRFQHPESV